MRQMDPIVTLLLDDMKHPFRKEIEALRSIILASDRRIMEGVKWNTASYRTIEWFATLNGARQLKEPMIILHAGAKAKGVDLQKQVNDPTKMIRWLGTERGQITFASLEEIHDRHERLQAVIRSWVAQF